MFRYAKAIDAQLEDEEQFAEQLKEYYYFGDSLRLVVERLSAHIDWSVASVDKSNDRTSVHHDR